MLYQNANVYCPDGSFRRGGFSVEGDRFARVLDSFAGESGRDLNGSVVIPGLIDIHTHGAAGIDFSDGDRDGMRRVAAYLGRSGVTSFAPTSMTLPYETLASAYQVALEMKRERDPRSARVLGIHMEGPFFSAEKCGAQDTSYLKNPDFDQFLKLYAGCEGLIRIADVAPELPGAREFIRRASELCRVSVAHTNADYEDAKAAFECGASHVTHLFNAMPPLHHRKPGVIGAASERDDVVAELICDGVHVHESAVRAAFRLFPDRVCMISDSLSCCGITEEIFLQNGRKLHIQGGVARLEDGTIAGAAQNLYQDLLCAVSFGIPRETAIRSCTAVPAGEIGCAAEIGSIENGKYADFLVCAEDLTIREIYIGGVQVE